MAFDNLESFLLYNNNKSVIAVQGLGFVGSVMSLVCANSHSVNYSVIGVDVPEMDQKIKLLNQGVFPLVAEDPKIEMYFNNALQKGNFYGTTDSSSFSYADIIIVDVNLDVNKTKNHDESLNSFDVDLSSFRNAIETIGTFCKEDVLVLVETTVPPGTCEKLVLPILRNKLSDRGLKTSEIKIAHSYERVMPGPEYIDSIQNYPRVYSGIDDKSADSAESFLKTIIDTTKCTLTRLSNTTATEMAKVLENSYRATNIAFAVEWSRFAEEAGVNLWSVVNAIRGRKTHANLMFPNIGVGGYCLTKDPLLASWARKNFFGSKYDLEMSVESVSTNDQMPVFAYKRLKSVFGQLDDQKIVFLGVSYRGDVGDTRFSPVETLYRLVKSDTSFIKAHDPYILRWDEVGVDIFFNLDDILTDDIDIIIISTAHSCYNSEELISKIMSLPRCKIFDAVGLFNNKQMFTLKNKHEVSILGSGDFT
jgi:UDP-N-acetyl-D-glucosamine dehydrogenase